jgi:hypothetical protein
MGKSEGIAGRFWGSELKRLPVTRMVCRGRAKGSNELSNNCGAGRQSPLNDPGRFSTPGLAIDGAFRCKQVNPAGASASAQVGARIPSKLVMRVRFSPPAREHPS